MKESGCLNSRNYINYNYWLWWTKNLIEQDYYMRITFEALNTNTNKIDTQALQFSWFFFYSKKHFVSRTNNTTRNCFPPSPNWSRDTSKWHSIFTIYMYISAMMEIILWKKRRSIAIEMKNILNINRYKNIFILRIHCIGYFLFHVICRVNSKYCNMHSFYHESISQTVYFYINMNAPMSYSH